MLTVLSLPASLLQRFFDASTPALRADASLRALDCLEYEDRTLFSATPVGGDALVAGAAMPAPSDSPTPIAEAAQVDASTVAATTAAPTSGNDGSASNATTSDGQTGAQQAPSASNAGDQTLRNELVIVDSSVSNYQQLVDDLESHNDESRHFIVEVIDGRIDGISQVTAILAKYQDLSAVHFVSHASDGTLDLGTTRLSEANVGGYAEAFVAWRQSLTADADLLFYGCELAASDSGRALLGTIEQLTGADVAASTNNTGSALFGGDWNLEFADGPIETSVAFSQAAQAEWINLLNVAVDSTSSGGTTGVNSLTVAHTTAGTNRLMLVGITIDPHGDAINSVTYDGVALTRAGQVYDAATHASVEIWYLVAPNTGTHDVVIDISGTSYNGMDAGVMTFTGVDQANPLGAFAGAFGQSTTATVTVASQVGDVVFGVADSHSNSTAPAPDPGQTEYWSLDNGKCFASGTLEAGAASVDQTWTTINDYWAVGAISIHSDNTAPTLDATKTPVLNNETEDAGAPSGAVGTLVSSLVDFAVPAGQVDNVTDPDAGALLGIAVTAADTTNGSWWYSTDNGTNWNALGAVAGNNARLLAADANTRIYFQPNADYAGTVAGAITFRAWDQTTGTNGSTADTTTNGGTTAFSAATDTANITVDGVNDAPVNTVPPAQSTPEKVDLTFSAANGNQISIADVDAGANDVQVTLSVSHGKLKLASTAGISFAPGSGDDKATMTFTGTIANINAALDGMKYKPSGAYNGNDTLTITTDDLGNTGSGGAQSVTDTVLINIGAVDDAPVNTVPSAQSTNENTALVFSSGNGNQISIDDIDAGTNPVQVTLTATNGLITLNGTTGLAFSAGTGTGDAAMTFTGTMTDINTALNGLSFAPTASFSGAANLQIVTNDQGNTGSGGPLTATDNVAITVNAVNDPPVNTVPPAQTTNEDTTLVFSSGNGNQISIADIDAGANPVQVTLTATNGAITLFGTTGLTFSAGDGTADATMTFTGTIVNINTALNGLSFAPTANYNGAANLQIVTNDQGNTGSGGPLTDTDNVAITVTAVNDAPQLSLSGSQTTPFRTSVTFSTSNGNALTLSDVDAGSAAVELTLSVQHGSLTLGQTAGITFVSGTGTNDAQMVIRGTQAALNAAINGLTYTPASTYRGTDTLSMTVNDLGNTGSGGPLSANGGVAIVVQPASQRLSLTAPSNQPSTNFTATFSSGGGNPLAFTDVYAENPMLSVSISTSNGTISLASTSGLTFTSGTGTGSSMSFSGTLDNVNAALNGATYNGSMSDGSLSIVGSDPPRDGTSAQTVSGQVAISQPPVYPAPPTPVIEPEIIKKSQDGGVPIIISAQLPPPVLAVINKTPARGDKHGDQVLAAPFVNPLSQDPQSASKKDRHDGGQLADDLNLLVLRSASINSSAAKAAPGARGTPLDLEIPWTPVLFSKSNPLDQPLSDSLIVGTAGITASLSVGYALWSMRAASLLSTLVSSMPAWQTFDPLPVIEFSRRAADKDEDEEDEESNQMFAAKQETP